STTTCRAGIAPRSRRAPASRSATSTIGPGWARSWPMAATPSSTAPRARWSASRSSTRAPTTAPPSTGAWVRWRRSRRPALPRRVPIAEADRTEPSNPYGATKLAFEGAMRWFCAAHDFRAISLRYFNVAGATERNGEDHDPETHLMPIVLRVAAGEATHVQIHGQDYPTPDGTCIRDFLHVRDIAVAHLLALEATGEGDASLEVYNLGSAAGFSVREVVEAARRVT